MAYWEMLRRGGKFGGGGALHNSAVDGQLNSIFFELDGLDNGHQESFTNGSFMAINMGKFL